MLRFSLEVVLRIVSHMNHYTVMAWLRAMPEYAGYAILVTDHKHCPLFFHVPEVSQRRHIAICETDSFVVPKKRVHPDELFTPEIAKRYPIRLYEVRDEHQYWVYGLRRLLRDNFEAPDRYTQAYCQPAYWINNPGFSNTSFVFVDISSDPYGLLKAEEVCTRLDFVTGSKWHAGLPTYPLAVGISRLSSERWKVFRNPVPVYHAVLPLARNFLSLRLENVPVVANLDLPRLSELVLVFNNSSSTVPVIEALKTPEIRHFLVHFDGQCPKFREMRHMNCPEKHIRTRGPVHPWPSPARTFELCHIDSIGGLTSACSRDQCFQIPRNPSDMSFSFLEVFHTIVASGVPWFILDKMGKHMTYSVQYLSLTLTETAGDAEELGITLNLRGLAHMILTLMADDLQLAKFERFALWEFHLRIKGLNPTGISGLWQLHEEYAKQYQGFGTLKIYSDPRLEARCLMTGKSMYLLTAGERNAIYRKLANRYIVYSSYDLPESRTTILGFPEY